jgi:hypothetical protein
MRFLFYLFLSLLVCNCVHAQKLPDVSKHSKLNYKIIQSDHSTWGYDIYDDTKLFVHQPTIPALPGNKGFDTKQAAEKVAKKVIEKIRKGESPPTVTIYEMKQMGVISQ